MRFSLVSHISELKTVKTGHLLFYTVLSTQTVTFLFPLVCASCCLAEIGHLKKRLTRNKKGGKKTKNTLQWQKLSLNFIF